MSAQRIHRPNIIHKRPSPAQGRALRHLPALYPRGGEWFTDGGSIDLANCIAAYKPIGAVSQGASYADLTGNGYDTTLGVAPTWDAVNGWTFDGIDDYLKTGVVPLTNDWSMMIRYTNWSSGLSQGTLIGIRNKTPDTYGFRIYGNGSRTYWENGGNKNILAWYSSGTLLVAANKGYRNGAQIVTDITPQTLPAFDIYIGCSHYGGPTDEYHTPSKVQVAAIWDIDVSSHAASLHTKFMDLS